jgi:hypothetical protein
MSEGWAIAAMTLVVTTSLSLLALGIKALWVIAKTFKQLVTRPECDKAMGDQCKDIESLRKGFIENKAAISQMVLAFRDKLNVEIKYEG